MLIGMDAIIEIVETAICSAMVEGSIPQSVMLVGRSGSGKSQALLLFDDHTKIPTAHRSDDLTAAGIFDICIKDHENKIAHILCPDFNVPLAHKDAVVAAMSAKMMTLMSDGLVRIDDGRQNKEVQHRQAGLLTAMTSDMYILYAKKWTQLGFKRRILPIFFDYSAKTEAAIQGKIRDGAPCTIVLKRNPLPPRLNKIKIKIGSKQAFALEQLSMTLSQNLSYYPKRDHKTKHIEAAPGETLLAFSPHHTLRTMAQAHAILKKRKSVINEDVNFIATMIDFCRFGSPVRI